LWVAFLVFVGYTLLLVQVVAPALHAGSGPTPTNVGLGISLSVVLVLCAIASTAAWRVRPPRRPLSEGLLAREARKATRHTTIPVMSQIPALRSIHSNVIQVAHLLLRHVWMIPRTPSRDASRLVE
jgi:hypothetical protein